MYLAGIDVADELVRELARLLRSSREYSVATTLEDALDAHETIVGLTIKEREAILFSLDDPPDGLDQLRSVLLGEQVARSRERTA